MDNTTNRIIRVKRLSRLFYPATWRALALFLTEPAHDDYFRRLRKANTHRYLSEPEPWFTFPAVSFLENNLKQDMTLFEWGAGSSTIWFSDKVKQVVSIEYDSNWYDALKNRLSSNVELLFSEESSTLYIDSIETIQDINVFVIDGRRRVDCAEKVLEYLTKNKTSALVVFDDAHRKRYESAIHELTSHSTRAWFFEGISNTVIAKTTAIFKF